LIADVSDNMGSLVSTRLISRLITGITREKVNDDDTKRECIDNMGDLLRRFGQLFVSEHEVIMHAVIRQLQNGKQVIRKRAALCLGSLAVVISDPLLNALVETLLSNTSNTSLNNTQTLIQTIGSISRTVGHRLGRHLEKIIPLFIRCCGDPEDESQQTDAANELREYCFPGLESFVLRCPREVEHFIPSILTTSLTFMTYDPNYSYDDDDEETADMDTGDNDEEDYGDGDLGGDDDDDATWKIRKAAVKVISAIISSRPELLLSLYQTCATPLISRFKEREENVRVDIIFAFSDLLRSTSVYIEKRHIFERITRSSIPSSSKSTDDDNAVLAILLENVPAILRSAVKQFNGQSIKTKSQLFKMLQSLMNTLKVIFP